MSAAPNFRVRPAAGEAAGALVLFHGRGADEHDLEPLLAALDPEQRLVGVLPRGPLALPPGGAHWYAVREIGYPDPETFLATYAGVSAWLDGLPDEIGVPPERTVLWGFSQGAMLALQLAVRSPAPFLGVAAIGSKLHASVTEEPALLARAAGRRVTAVSSRPRPREATACLARRA